MSRHPLDPTSHTIEMEQISELNARLVDRHAPTVTSGELGLSGVRLPRSGGQTLSGNERVVRVSWRGAPDFPDVYAEFGAHGGSEPFTMLLLHTENLRELSRLLHCSHYWGL